MRTERTPSSTPSSASPYQTLRPLARGGMGSVDIAMLRKPGFRRLFAIKRLRPELVEDERAKAMLLEEGRIAGLLRHPNIVPVVDVGEDEQGPFLVMDLVPGVALGDLVRWARAAKTMLDVQLVCRLVRDACRGLHAAHELRDVSGKPLALVHRDISPQNILVGFDGIARVTDFGIAKVLDRDRETTHGLLKGKTGYMSPEQLRFETIDRRADLFSLGVVLHELLAAERLYRGKDLPETARMILHAPPPDIGTVRKDVPPEIVELLFELLAKDREARPATAKEVGDRLEAAIHALVQDEGVFDLESFLRTELADRFEETTQWSRLLDGPIPEPDEAPTDPSPRPSIDAPVALAAPASIEVSVEAAGASTERRWLASLAAGLVAAVVAVALAMSGRGVASSVESSPEVTSGAPTSPVVAASGGSGSQRDEPSVHERAADEEASTEEASTEEASTDEGPPERAADRARGRRGARGGRGARPVAQRERPDAGPRRRIVDQEFWTEK